MAARALLLCMFLAFPDSAGASPHSGAPPASFAACRGNDAAFADKAEALIAAGIDAERAKQAPDAPMLRPDSNLASIARRRSCDMAHGADFSHTDAAGRAIAVDMVSEIFGNYGAVGENIIRMGDAAMAMIGAARSFGPEEFSRAAVESWMKSPEHRANIIDAHFDSSGIGVAIVDGQAFATQIFRGPMRQRKSFKGFNEQDK